MVTAKTYLGQGASFIAALMLLTACGTTGMAGPEVIAGDENTVSIASGKFIDPTDAAEDFCAGYDREAVYVDRGILNKSGMMDLYIYDCVPPGTIVEDVEVKDEIEEVAE